jgi:acetylglutamate kinase
VIAPIGVGDEGEAYNINADLVAGKLAETLSAEKLVLMTNITGVLDKEGKVVHNITRSRSIACRGRHYSGGMIPKIAGALDAVKMASRRHTSSMAGRARIASGSVDGRRGGNSDSRRRRIVGKADELHGALEAARPIHNCLAPASQ